MKLKERIDIQLLIPSLFLVLLWVIKLTEIIFGFNLIQVGIFPRKFSGLIGILLSPVIHADLNHLISNSLPLLFLSTGIVYFFKTSRWKVILSIYFISGILIWIFARSAYHIGASGLIYGFASFLFFSGVIRRDTRSIALSLIVTFLYGGMIWGILPVDYKVSWEAHLIGGIVGFLFSILFRKKDPPKRYDWEDEEVDENENQEKPEISYKKGYPFD
ncbi:MAG: rhomboid family intramembrane serine protease [Ignavibacteriales bacterium]|nr:rhomboid family intramembrane serine protease [Ignavibacteriales bacterium]